jgi:acyl-CoA hydrolase
MTAKTVPSKSISPDRQRPSSLGKTFYSGLGGQGPIFMRGAVARPGREDDSSYYRRRSQGGKVVSRNCSLFAAFAEGGRVTHTLGGRCTLVVTEHGIAYLQGGRNVRERRWR